MKNRLLFFCWTLLIIIVCKLLPDNSSQIRNKYSHYVRLQSQMKQKISIPIDSLSQKKYEQLVRSNKQLKERHFKKRIVN